MSDPVGYDAHVGPASVGIGSVFALIYKGVYR